jgi:hypothetical protein
VEAGSVVDQADAGAGAAGGAGSEAYRQRSYELWQQMARRWERGREVLWGTTRPVSEWLVERLSPHPRQTILGSRPARARPGFWPRVASGIRVG